MLAPLLFFRSYYSLSSVERFAAPPVDTCTVSRQGFDKLNRQLDNQGEDGKTVQPACSRRTVQGKMTRHVKLLGMCVRPMYSPQRLSSVFVRRSGVVLLDSVFFLPDSW